VTEFLETDQDLRARLADLIENKATFMQLASANGQALDDLAVKLGTERQTSPEHVVVQYFIIRSSLKLSGGKPAAQVGHAEMFFMEAYYDLRRFLEHTHTTRSKSGAVEKVTLIREWRAGEYGKITLAASDEEFEELKDRYGTDFLVIDNGHTQVAPKTETCLGLWPMRKSQRCELLKSLKPLR